MHFILFVVSLLFLAPLAAEVTEEGREIGHECGVALVRLRKPIEHFISKYNDPAWGTKKLLFLMEKQRNRGQDGAGIAIVKFNVPPGHEYLHQLRSAAENSLDDIVSQVVKDLQELGKKNLSDETGLKQQSPYIGEALLGHLRYATHSGLQIKYTQPFVRSHHVPCRHFALAGNFNMTNTSDLFEQLGDFGVVPTCESDTQVIIDMLAYNLDETYIQLARHEQQQAGLLTCNNAEPIPFILKPQIDIAQVLKQTAVEWDGGYVFCGLVGNGDVFACRDPAGIRPGYYYMDDEVIAVASERAALIEAFDTPIETISSLKPGHVLVIKRNGEVADSPFAPPLPERQCTFERIYFSKANDPEVYLGRKALGRCLAKRVFEELNGDLDHTIFTFVPNSSISAFQGLVEEISSLAHRSALEKVKLKLAEGADCFSEMERLANVHAKVEYIIAKNQKLRTFISSDKTRKNLVSQLYEVTRGIATPEDTLVVVDDSIVRGTTLRESLIPKLLSLNPKKIIFVSSAPPVMYPDCYGIDMSQLGRFIAFEAAVSLLEEHGKGSVVEEVHQFCLHQKNRPAPKMFNAVKKIYEPWTLEDISNKIAKLVAPDSPIPIRIIYQSIDGLHQALPGYTGDWYFSGDYPTAGGFKVLNNSFLRWRQQDDSRSY